MLLKYRYSQMFTESLQLWIEDELIAISTNWNLGCPLMIANVNGKEVAVQFEKRNGQLLHLRHYGNKVAMQLAVFHHLCTFKQYSVLVLDSLQAELSNHIPEKSDVCYGNYVRQHITLCYCM